MGLQLNEQSSGWISTPPTRSAWYSLCSARTAQLSVETPLLIMLPVRLQILFTLENKQDLISWNHLIEKGHKNKTRRRGVGGRNDNSVNEAEGKKMWHLCSLSPEKVEISH